MFLLLLYLIYKSFCSYGTTLCLQYKPRQIAAGAFFLAAEHLTVDLQSYGEGLFQEFDTTPGQLEGMC